VSVRDSFDTVEPSAEELLDRIWSNFVDITRPKAERLVSLTVDVPLFPDEALMGGRAQVLVPARITCPSCRGQELWGRIIAGDAKAGARGSTNTQSS
jgi:hypothetical protein